MLTYKRIKVFLLVFALSCFAVSPGRAADNTYSPTLATQAPNVFAFFIAHVAVGDVLYYDADDGSHGKELWRSDGTATGTYMVKDINPAGDSNPGLWSGFAVLNNKIYFSADDGTNGYELWVSDGTSEGTRMVKDIWPGSNESSGPSSIVQLGDSVYFSAEDGTTSEYLNSYSEAWVSGNVGLLYKSDGTEAGTSAVKTVDTGTIKKMGNKIYFGGSLPNSNNSELWESDGTTGGTQIVKDFTDEDTEYVMVDIRSAINSRLYFNVSSYSDTAYITGWSSDGSGAGTVATSETVSDSLDSQTCEEGSPFLNGSCFFSNVAHYLPDYKVDIEPWISNGTISGTKMLKQIRSDYEGTSWGSGAGGYTELDGKVYFGADDGVSGIELWESDGTESGTQLFKDINPSGSSSASSLFKSGDYLYFQANDGTNGSELWISDGTVSGTKMLQDINPSGNSYPQSFVQIGEKLFFTARPDGTTETLYTLDTSSPGLAYPTFVSLPGGGQVINLTDSQTITQNPYTIRVSPQSVFGISKVDFYVDDNLICTSTEPDPNGVYACDWDTSQYHSDIKVLAYDDSVDHNESQALERTTTVSLGSTAATVPAMTVLPQTGKGCD